MDRLAALIANGCDLRLWCFRCGRGDARPVPVEMLPRILDKAVCWVCRKRDQVLALPARSSFVPVKEGHGSEQAVAGYFHAMRGAAKRRR